MGIIFFKMGVTLLVLSASGKPLKHLLKMQEVVLNNEHDSFRISVSLIGLIKKEFKTLFLGT